MTMTMTITGPAAAVEYPETEMVTFTACRPRHLAALDVGIPLELMARLNAAAEDICNEYAWAAFSGCELVGAGGILVHWRGIDDVGGACGFGEAWARVGQVPMRAWPAITRRVRTELDLAAAAGIRLIECTVDMGFAAGHRWAERLGFEVACRRPSWGVTGHDAVLYQRHRPPPPGRQPATRR
mgnify:CR=1 FL=1